MCRRCDELRVAPYVVFAAAFLLYLRESTGRDALGIWIECPNRDTDEAEDAVGWLMNRHLLGVEIRTESSGTALLEACRAAIVDAHRHQAIPLPFLWRRIGRNCERRRGLREDHGTRFSPDLCVRVIERQDDFVLSAAFMTARFARAVRHLALGLTNDLDLPVGRIQ